MRDDEPGSLLKIQRLKKAQEELEQSIGTQSPLDSAKIANELLSFDQDESRCRLTELQIRALSDSTDLNYKSLALVIQKKYFLLYAAALLADNAHSDFTQKNASLLKKAGTTPAQCSENDINTLATLIHYQALPSIRRQLDGINGIHRTTAEYDHKEEPGSTSIQELITEVKRYAAIIDELKQANANQQKPLGTDTTVSPSPSNTDCNHVSNEPKSNHESENIIPARASEKKPCIEQLNQSAKQQPTIARMPSESRAHVNQLKLVVSMTLTFGSVFIGGGIVVLLFTCGVGMTIACPQFVPVLFIGMGGMLALKGGHAAHTLGRADTDLLFLRHRDSGEEHENAIIEDAERRLMLSVD